MLGGYYQKSKTKKNASKRSPEKYQDLCEENQNRNCQHTCEQYINILEEEKKTKSVNMVANDIKIFLKIKNKG